MVAKDSIKNATWPSNASGSGWIVASDLRRRLRGPTINKGSREIDVAAAYHNNVLSTIVPIVSVLEFPSSSWETQFLEVSMSDSSITGDSGRGRQNNYALADSVLRINPDRHDGSIPPQSAVLEDMRTVASYFDRIIPFEFKSLSSGSYATMLGILGHTLEKDFPWQGCSKFCAYEHGPKLGREPVTGDPVGLDAIFPGLNFRISDWAGKNRKEFQVLKDGKQSTTHGRNMLQQVIVYASRYSTLTHYCMHTQQIWTEMVKYDATYSVLHAGNYELLLLRNRQDQTLYISDIIEPHTIGEGMPGSPGYYQIHIGLFISAIRDAVARARQLKEFGGAEDVLPDTWTRPYDRGGKYKPVSWIFSSYNVRSHMLLRLQPQNSRSTK